MGLVIVSQPLSSSVLAVPLRRPSASPAPHRIRRRAVPGRWFYPPLAAFRPLTFSSKCSITDTDVDFEQLVHEEEILDEISSIPSGCSIPVVHFQSETLDAESLNLLTEDSYVDNLLTTLPVLSEEEQDALAAIPAHPAGLYALYACSLAGNLVEQLWNFAWPAAVALLHPSLLPVAVVGFFTKLMIFIGGPLIGNLMDCLPRVHGYNCLNLVQAAAQLLSVTMIIHALSSVPHTSASSVLLQPWFVLLVLAAAVERLAGLALGIAVERDWVVLLAGTNRPIALAQANAILNRLDLLCEIAGASVFGILLSKHDTVTCLKLAARLIICTLPVMVLLVFLTNKLSAGVLDRCKFSCSSEKPLRPELPLLDPGNLVKRGINVIKHGWMEYKKQPVLPASIAYVLLYFNVVLSPGGLMTSFLTQRGLNPSIIGGFSGLCAFMGVAATFISASLVKQLGVLKAGAAGLIFQASLLSIAVAVYWSGSLSQKMPLFFFLSLIILSRLGHMSYDVVGAQILQTGIPSNKANLIGATEVSLASLAEFIMLGVVIIANDLSHFGFLAMLSVSSVVGAALLFCWWLANPTYEQRNLFLFDPQF